ncbi:MAG: hypothetical protein SGI96_00485 [Bacteroidota bacterium]|nr:hypothetical protein [Chitinophagaceae bacterium]MDZ4806725.1 hypothetical protein [Bacteroidota bacterium]
MGTINTIDKEIAGYLPQLSAVQKQAVLGVIKTFAVEKEEYDRWNDKNFITEMDGRTAELENGSVKGFSWTEVKKRARKSLKTQKMK